MAKETVKRSIVLDLDENEAISAIAEEERRSFNSVVRQAIVLFLRWRREQKEAA